MTQQIMKSSLQVHTTTQIVKRKMLIEAISLNIDMTQIQKHIYLWIMFRVHCLLSTGADLVDIRRDVATRFGVELPSHIVDDVIHGVIAFSVRVEAIFLGFHLQYKILYKENVV